MFEQLGKDVNHWVSEQVYHGENKVIFNEMMMMRSTLY